MKSSKRVLTQKS